MLYFFGVVCAITAGLIQPFFGIFLPDVVNKLGPNVDIDDLKDEAFKVLWIALINGAVVWMLFIIFMPIFGNMSETISRRFRIKYLEAILN